MTPSSLHFPQTTVTERRTACNYYTHQIGFVNHPTFALLRIIILNESHFLSILVYFFKYTAYFNVSGDKIYMHNFPKKLLASPRFPAYGIRQIQKGAPPMRSPFANPVMNLYCQLLDCCMIEVLHSFYSAVNTLNIILNHVWIVVVVDRYYTPGIHEVILCGVH